MTALNRADIRAAVRFRGDYQNVLKFPDADVNREIQSTFGDFWRIIADTHQGWWDKLDTSISTTANQAFVALPADCWRLQGLDLLDGSEYVELIQVGLEARNRFGTTAAMPEAYRTSARGCELYATPDKVYGLRFHYTPVPDALADGTSREWFTDWEEYVIEGTLLRLDRRERKPLGDRQDAVDRAERALKSGASERRSQEPEYIPLREFDEMLSPEDRGIFR